MTGFGNIRYDVSHVENFNQDMFDLLKHYGVREERKFWRCYWV